MPDITIISAGAGSGKTYDLCQKYFSCISGKDGRDPVQPRRILATTFTKKAATELVGRLRKKLLEEGLGETALLIEDGYIGTVHSVCLALLKDFALDKDISPDISPLPEEDEDRIFQQATAEVMHRHGRTLRILAANLNMDAYLPYGGPAGLEDWDKTVRNLCKLARSNGLGAKDLLLQGEENAKQFAEILPDALSKKESAKIASRLHKEMQTALDALENNGDKQKNTAEVKDLLRNCLETEHMPWQDWQRLADAAPGKSSSNACTAFKELATQFPAMWGYQQDLLTYIREIFTCAAETLDAYANWKKSYGLLDYNDMEALALELLQDPKVVRILRGRVRQVYVDEFQDTSPLQLALFLKLAQISRKSSWVGDTKQAIYGFRGTDPVLMQKAVAMIGKTEKLPYSWRSRKSLVDFTNAFFAKAFSVCGYSSKSVILDLPDERKKDDHLPSGLRFWQGDGKEDDLAEYVRLMLSRTGDKACRIIDAETKLPRQVSAGDIAILCRSNSQCSKVAQALKDHGVSADVAVFGLLAQPEIVFLLACYRLCIFKGDTVAMLEILRLLEPDMSMWIHEVLTEGEKTLSNRVFASLKADLEEVRSMISALTPSEALHKTISVLDGVRCVARWGDQKQRLANLDMLCGKALQYEEACRVRHESCTHSGFIHWLSETGDMEQASGNSKNAVHVLTYHGSKGLEWPMVILHSMNNSIKKYTCFGLNMMPPGDSFDLDNPLKDRKIHYWPWPCGTKQSLVAAIKERVDARSDKEIFDTQTLQEELRLLYVGMTRARDILVFYMAEVDKPSRPRDAWLRSVLPEGEDLILPTKEKPCFKLGKEKFPVIWDEFEDDGEEEQEESILEAMDAEPLAFIAPPEGEKPDFPPREITANNLQQAWALASGYAVKALAGTLSWETEKNPVDVGNIIHAWLAIDMPTLYPVKMQDEERAERLAYFKNAWGLGDENLDLPAVSEFLHLALKDLCKQHNLGNIVCYKTEWPVFQKIGNRTLNGRMDLLCECENGCILVDHKFLIADASPDLYKQTVADYSGQVSAYLEALRKSGYAKILACLHLPAQGTLLVYGQKKRLFVTI